MMTPNTPLVLKLAASTVSVWPRPCSDAMISPPITPSSANTSPSRRPLKITGTALGNVNLRKICTSLAPSVRASVM